MIVQISPLGKHLPKAWGGCAEPYPQGSFGRNGQRPTQHWCPVRDGKSDALRWGVFAAPFFDAHRVQACYRSGDPLSAAQPSLQCGRDAAGLVVSDGAGSGANRDDSTAATERCLSVFDRAALLSGSLHDAPLSVASGPAGPVATAQLHDRFLSRMLARRRTPARLIFDLDSTVLVLYGRQENARVGYNPSKPGRRSYYPLLCFEARTRDFWHGELRPGDVGTPRGALEYAQACFRKIPQKGQRAILRADKGFFDHKLIDWVEEQGAGYVIVARLTPPIQRRLSGLRYHRLGWRVETATFRYH